MTSPLVLCIAADDYDLVWSFCIAAQEEYCVRNGFEYRLVREKRSDLNAKWTKLAVALDAVREGRDVLLLDADAHPLPRAPPFQVAMTGSGAEIFAATGNSGRFNSGVLMLRGGASGAAARFLEECLASRHEPVPAEDHVTDEGENGHVIHFLRLTPHADSVAVLGAEWNCTNPENASGAHILHYTNLMREDLVGGAAGRAVSVPVPAVNRADALTRLHFGTYKRARERLRRDLAEDPLFKVRFTEEILHAAVDLALPRLPVDDPNGWLWRYEFVSGLLEAPTIAFLRHCLRPEGVLLDGGAHVGAIARAVGLIGKGRQRIIAVEAHPENIACCRSNLARFNAEIIHAALDERDGVTTLFDGLGHSNASLVREISPDHRRFRVASRRVDTLLDERKLASLDLLKLDVEGAELRALRGARTVLERSAAVAIIESNPRLLGESQAHPIDLVRFMAGLGYVGRLIRADFSLGPRYFVPFKGTHNIAFAREERWVELEMRWAAASTKADNNPTVQT